MLGNLGKFCFVLFLFLCLSTSTIHSGSPSKQQPPWPHPARVSVKTPPPNTSILGKHGRGSETSSETGDKGEDGGGAAFSQACGLRTVPEQVSFPIYICAQKTINCINHTNRWQSRTGTYNYALTYIIDGTRTSVQLCHKKRYRTNRYLRPYKRLCLFACNNTVSL